LGTTRVSNGRKRGYFSSIICLASSAIGRRKEKEGGKRGGSFLPPHGAACRPFFLLATERGAIPHERENKKEAQCSNEEGSRFGDN